MSNDNLPKKIQYAYRFPRNNGRDSLVGLRRSSEYFVQASNWLHPKPAEVTLRKCAYVGFDYLCDDLPPVSIRGEEMHYVGSFTGPTEKY